MADNTQTFKLGEEVVKVQDGNVIERGGTERTDNDTTYTEFNETITVTPYDDVELWLKTSSGGQYYYMQNFLLQGNTLISLSY